MKFHNDLTVSKPMSGAEPCLCHVNFPKLNSYCHLSPFFGISIVIRFSWVFSVVGTDYDAVGTPWLLYFRAERFDTQM
jgi:hypothetical protein